MLTIN